MNQLLWRLLPPRARSAWTTLRHRRRERRCYEDFRRFYDGLADQRDIFFLFFTERLLHWALKALQFVPAEINLVVVGSHLEADEVEWLRRRLGRPFHHVPVRIDDKTMWEFLWRCARHDFGWLDIDCFVANPRLFSEMARIDGDVALNCVYAFPGAGNVDIMCTHLLFVNVGVLRAIERRGIAVTPCTYNYDGSNVGRGEFSFSKVPTRRQLRLLRRVLPAGSDGRPVYPSNVPARFFLRCFDTLVLYQLVALALGYRLHRVRALSGTPETPAYFSDEVIHVNAASWYVRMKDDRGQFQEHYRRMVQLDYFLLCEAGDDLPAHYGSKREELRAELDRLGIPLALVPRTVYRYFADRGFGANVAQHPAWRFLREWHAREQDAADTASAASAAGATAVAAAGGGEP
ncbi:MAG TPA: hypothetical protein VHG32_11305 [Thermoanaerobaculia bacterium]|jgi:hypothetical protein|nr:hypothetical protein [Thermoanaerobaculia bacterium]